MTRRIYSEVAHSYAPFQQAVLQGLGASGENGWPAGRSYVGIAHFRAPYDEFGYFQDNTLQGLNGAMSVTPGSSYVSVNGMGGIAQTELFPIDNEAPGSVKRFLLSGEPVSPIRKDMTLPFNQVHPYVYGVVALATLATSYYSYKTWKKTHKS